MQPHDGPGRLLLDYQLDTTVTVVVVNGEIDVATCGSLRDSLLLVLANEACSGIVVNLADTTFIDSTGVGVLVGIWHRARSGHKPLALAAPSRQAQAMLKSTGLTDMLPIYGSQAEAVQVCREAADR
jgi:anti-sigma B factor antagonist